MTNNIIELCALLCAMDTQESKDNQGLRSELTELHKLVYKKAQTDVIQSQIRSILEVYTFLETPYVECQQALARQQDNDKLYQALQALMVDGNVMRNQPPRRKTPREIDQDKGNERDNLVVDIADHLKNCSSPDREEKGKAYKAIVSIKAILFRQ